PLASCDSWLDYPALNVAPVPPARPGRCRCGRGQRRRGCTPRSTVVPRKAPEGNHESVRAPASPLMGSSSLGVPERTKQRQLLGVLRAGLGMEGAQDQAAPVAKRELLAVQRQRTDLRVVEGHGAAGEGLDVVPCPELAEPLAGQGELPDELDSTRVVGIASDRGAKGSHQRRAQ